MRIKKNRYIKQWLLILSYVLVFCLSFMGTTIFMHRYDVKITPKALQPNQNGCTMEALLCPDGTAVGRSGPNCEEYVHLLKKLLRKGQSQYQHLKIVLVRAIP